MQEDWSTFGADSFVLAEVSVVGRRDLREIEEFAEIAKRALDHRLYNLSTQPRYRRRRLSELPADALSLRELSAICGAGRGVFPSMMGHYGRVKPIGLWNDNSYYRIGDVLAWLKQIEPKTYYDKLEAAVARKKGPIT